MIAAACPTGEYELAACYDRQIHAAATAALATSKYGPLRKLNCRVSDGVVEISGTVASFYLKQLAQAAMLQLFPAGALRNLVEVSEEPSLLVATHCGGPLANPAH